MIKINKIFIFFAVVVTINHSHAQLVDTVLTCRVETIVKKKDLIVDRKNENITVELSQLNNNFVIGGFGDLAMVYGTNNPQSQGVSNIDDRSTDSIFEVDFSKASTNPTTGKIVIEDMYLKLDRVSGKLTATKTFKSYNAKMFLTGSCEKSNRKF